VSNVRELRDGLWMIDVEEFGVPGYGAVYLIVGDGVALVETGTSHAVPHVREGLAAAGVRPRDVRYMLVTHVHLDHAGATGHLAREFTGAQIVVHPRGAHHLAAPERLLASVRSATGENADAYGTLIPVPEGRIVAAEDDRAFSLGARRIRAIHAPGHAPHHMCFWVEPEGWLFTGDAAGIWRRGAFAPTTPPPSFDLEHALAALHRLSGFKPREVCYTHFGLAERPGEALGSYAQFLTDWVERVGRELADVGGDEDEAVHRLIRDPEVMSWPFNERSAAGEAEMCVRGVLGYLRRAA